MGIVRDLNGTNAIFNTPAPLNMLEGSYLSFHIYGARRLVVHYPLHLHFNEINYTFSLYREDLYLSFRFYPLPRNTHINEINYILSQRKELQNIGEGGSEWVR